MFKLMSALRPGKSTWKDIFGNDSHGGDVKQLKAVYDTLLKSPIDEWSYESSTSSSHNGIFSMGVFRLDNLSIAIAVDTNGNVHECYMEVW